MVACPACGEPRTGDSTYCDACGTRLDPIDDDATERSEAVTPAAAAPPPVAPAPTFAPPSTPPTSPPAAPLPMPTTSSGPSPKVLVAAVALVVALVAGAFVLLGGDDDGENAADAVTTTVPPLVTSPQLTDEEYLVDVLAADRGSSPLADEGEDSCFFRSMIAAMGGAEGLRASRIPPEQLSGTFPLRGEVVPADAVDTFLATNATCGLDLTEVIFVRPVSIAYGDATASCVSVGIDRPTLNRLVAAFFLDPNRSDFSFVAPDDLVRQTDSLIDGCV
jgi:hypothetical protein